MASIQSQTTSRSRTLRIFLSIALSLILAGCAKTVTITVGYSDPSQPSQPSAPVSRPAPTTTPWPTPGSPSTPEAEATADMSIPTVAASIDTKVLNCELVSPRLDDAKAKYDMSSASALEIATWQAMSIDQRAAFLAGCQ